jgi:hypothetical protein
VLLLKYMPTQKQRINLTVPKELNKALVALAKRDHTTVATKTIDLVKVALEIEEDIQLLKIVEERASKPTKFISHAKAWL